jgi:hypothetical protein
VVLLVLGIPILILLLALALERLETRLLPARDARIPDRDEVPGESLRPDRSGLYPPRVTSGTSYPPNVPA